MNRLDRLAAVIATPAADLARERGISPLVAMKAQLKAAERLLPFIPAGPRK